MECNKHQSSNCTNTYFRETPYLFILFKDENDDDLGRNNISLEEVLSQGIEAWREDNSNDTGRDLLFGDFAAQVGMFSSSGSLKCK